MNITQEQLNDALNLIKQSNPDYKQLNNKLFELYLKDKKANLSQDESLSYLLLLENTSEIIEDFYDCFPGAKEFLLKEEVDCLVKEVAINTIGKCTSENIEDFNNILTEAIFNNLQEKYALLKWEKGVAETQNNNFRQTTDLNEFSKLLKKDATLLLFCFRFMPSAQQLVVSDYFGIADNLPKTIDEISNNRDLTVNKTISLLNSGLSRLKVALLPPEELTDEENNLRVLVFKTQHEICPEILESFEERNKNE